MYKPIHTHTHTHTHTPRQVHIVERNSYLDKWRLIWRKLVKWQDAWIWSIYRSDGGCYVITSTPGLKDGKGSFYPKDSWLPAVQELNFTSMLWGKEGYCLVWESRSLHCTYSSCWFCVYGKWQGRWEPEISSCFMRSKALQGKLLKFRSVLQHNRFPGKALESS